MWITEKVHPQAYNLPIALMPHLVLLIAIPCFLFELQVVLVESFTIKCVNSLVLACILYVFTQKSLRVNHSDKHIKKINKQPERSYLERCMQTGDKLVDDILDKSFAQGVRQPLLYYKYETYKHIENTPEFNELQEQLRVMPSWVDKERIKKAYLFYRDNLTLILAGMAIGLIESYTYPSDAKVNFYLFFISHIFLSFLVFRY